MTGNEDRVINSINHRPRRLGGPAATVAAVLVLVVVLILTGLHSGDSGSHHGKTTGAVDVHAHPPRDDDWGWEWGIAVTTAATTRRGTGAPASARRR